MNCTVEQRTLLRRAIEAIEPVNGVEATLVEPSPDGHDQWSLEATCRGGCVPSVVLGILAGYRLDLRESQPQGNVWFFRATVANQQRAR